MKAIYCTSIVALSLAVSSPGQQTTAYTVAERGPHHRVWANVTWQTNAVGRITVHTNSYTELATAMHHLVSGKWADSSDQIQIAATGAQATNSQHHVAFLGNINSPGAVDITLPEGQHLIGNVQGLSYFDTASGKSVMIAQVKDSDGELLPSGNRALYRDAFSGLSADVLYVNAVSGFEQLIVLRQQPPSPATWGLDPATTVIQVITEFLNPPEPCITPSLLRGAVDHHLSFGAMQMGKGEAFALGSETNTIPVTKQWLILDGRTCLVEQVPLPALQSQLQNLPPASPGSANLRGSTLYQVANRHLLPDHPPAAKRPSALKIAAAPPRGQGVVLDYSLLTSQTNLILQGDTTYYVSGTVNVSGTTTIEGGTVVKFTNSPVATIVTSNVVCRTAAFRPAIFTAKDDNTVGENISGSTADPTTNYYGGIALDLSGAYGSPDPGAGPVVSNVRFSYLNSVLCGIGIALRNAQIVRCNVGFAGSAAGYSHPAFYNVLIDRVNTGVYSDELGGDNVVGENLTAHNCPMLIADFTSNIWLTNCLFVCVSNWQCYTAYTNSSVFLSSDPGVFQTVGAASHYLADQSPYRNAGTTNIDSTLLADLRKKTTYPPLVYSNVMLSADMTLGPQAQRDTDAPDLGYHYDPLDFVLKGVFLTNATLQLLSGTAVATFGQYGISVHNGSHLISEGTPTSLNHIARYNMVQEGANTNWDGGGDSVVGDWQGGPTPPQASFRFTDWSMPAQDGHHFTSSTYSTISSYSDCQFHGGGLSFGVADFTVTNSLLERAYTYVSEDNSALTPTIRNCLFYGGQLYIDRFSDNIWTFRDNVFDQTSITQPDGDMDAANNAYITNCDRLMPTNVTDVLVTNFNWQTSWLGNYYLPSDSPLIDKGSTDANLVGLYHYTTQTNQVKETNSIVDIGFHYVAVDEYGNPIDTNGDGLPDYLSDSNGNGAVDSGEIGWNIVGDLGLKVLITRPKNNSTIP